MSTTLRRTTAGLAAVLLALMGFFAAQPARAVVNNQAAATQVASYLVSEFRAGRLTGSGLADAIPGVAATGGNDAAVLEMIASLKGSVSTVATSPGGAAKVAIAAMVVGENPSSFGGVDLMAKVRTETGSSYIMSVALVAIALERNGEPLPQGVHDALVHAAAATVDSAWGDLDSAGLVLLALSGLPTTDAPAQATIADLTTKLQAKLVNNQYWPSYSPSNTAGTTGTAWQATGHDVSAMVAWLAGQAGKTGTGLPSSLDGTSANLLASEQGLWLLAGVNLLTTKAVPVVATPTPTPTPSASATPSTTPTPTPAPTTPTWTPPAPGPANATNACTDGGGVWVVIEVRSVAYKSGCASKPVSAEDALTKIGVSITHDQYGMICDLDGQTTANCTTSAYPTYWTFWTATKPAAPVASPAATGTTLTGWTYAMVGPATYAPPAGTMVGFNFSADVAPRPVAPAATTVPAPTAPDPTITVPATAVPTTSAPAEADPATPAATAPNEPAPNQLGRTGGEPLTLALAALGASLVGLGLLGRRTDRR